VLEAIGAERPDLAVREARLWSMGMAGS
jgi:hypothetical protein